MDIKKFSLLLFVIGLFLYNYLFWGHAPGFNLPVFTLFLASCMLLANPESLRDKKVWLMGGGVLVSAFSLIWFGSFISYFMHLVSVILFAGLVKASEVRSLVAAGWNGFISVFTFFKSMGQAVPHIKVTNKPVNKSLQYLQISIIPIFIVLVFYILYSISNPIFSKLTNNLWLTIKDVFIYFFEDISVARLFFLFFGLVFIGAALNRFTPRWISSTEKAANDELHRQRRDIKGYYKGYSGPFFPMMALKKEHMMATLLLVMVNIMLLVVNIIDISWIWFDFSIPTGSEKDLKQFVHEGTYMLILSIFLSMGILLYYFRNNLNFYRKNELLKKLAYLWVAQNAILCISVLLRNYHYIDYHGLAYKRIGVMIFLAMTFIGLVTLFFKIKNRRSLYYLIRLNSWSIWAILLVTTLIQWDVLIAKYNLGHKNPSGIDTDFYLQLSPAALPVVYENMEKVKEQLHLHKNFDREQWIAYEDLGEFMERLNRSRDRFLDRYKGWDWRSKTLSDMRAYKALSSGQDDMASAGKSKEGKHEEI